MAKHCASKTEQKLSWRHRSVRIWQVTVPCQGGGGVGGEGTNVRDCYVVSYQLSFICTLNPTHRNLPPPLDGEQLEGLWLFHLCIPSAGFLEDVQHMSIESTGVKELSALKGDAAQASLWPGGNDLLAVPGSMATEPFDC